MTAAIYIRVSTLDQAQDGYSLTAQEETLRKWCKDHHYSIYDIYADRGISGKDIDHRPDMIRLMSDAAKKKFDIVVCWALSRFTRSVSDLYGTMAKFARWGVSLASYTEAFDTSSPMGRAMLGIIGVFAQLERELTAERVKAAMDVRASQGKRMCNLIIGYDKDGKDGLRINEREAEYVRFCYAEYLRYKNLSEVAALARSRGYRGKRGKPPEAWHIEVILTRPTYCGYTLHDGKLYRANHPPIIDIAMYNKVQRLLKKQGKLAGRSRIYELPEMPTKS